MMAVPFFRPSITEAEVSEVVDTLRSGWLTTGPKTKRFEADFAAFVGARHAVALNSCTAALHLALDAIGLRRGELVLVPTMTFAATAEVVRYFDAVPVFVDCDESLGMSPTELARTARAISEDKPVAGLKPPYGKLRAVIPMHYGGLMADMAGIAAVAKEFRLDIIEDAAHALPARSRAHDGSWAHAGTLGRVGCFSFYANKCITTGEGGMAVTNDAALAERMRIMSLHGMSKDAWKRFTGSGDWYYEIVAPGFKYNLTDIAAALGLQQLRRAQVLCDERQTIATRYTEAFQDHPALEVPPAGDAERQHAWHLYALRLRPERLSIDRAGFISRLQELGVHCSVHWQPLHLMPYYRETYELGPGMFPAAEQAWPRLVSLPLFPGMQDAEIQHVIEAVHTACGT